ncbi:MAG: heme-binding protein [Myxococcales bacterium]|nr:heme-binding protein [Myxococcales bacterium]
MTTTRRLPWSLGALALSACSVFGESNVEKAGYETLAQSNPYEVRRYDDLVLVSTVATGPYGDASDAAFRRLFDYISGENATREKVEMTAPVVQERKGEKVAMTAPVLQEASAEGWKMSFVLPASYTLATAPAPTDPAVRLESRPGEKVAVRRFSGLVGDRDINEEAAELRRWIELNGYEAASDEVRVARYNPPWTIPFLRRNEILIAIR